MLYYHIPPFTQPWICDLAYVSLSIYLSHENSFFTHSHFLCTAASLFGSVTSAVQTNGMCVRWTGQVRLVSSHLSFFNASYGYAYLCLASQVLWFIHYYLLLLSHQSLPSPLRQHLALISSHPTSHTLIHTPPTPNPPSPGCMRSVQCSVLRTLTLIVTCVSSLVWISRWPSLNITTKLWG